MPKTDPGRARTRERRRSPGGTPPESQIGRSTTVPSRLLVAHNGMGHGADPLLYGTIRANATRRGQSHTRRGPWPHARIPPSRGGVNPARVAGRGHMRGVHPPAAVPIPHASRAVATCADSTSRAARHRRSPSRAARHRRSAHWSTAGSLPGPWHPAPAGTDPAGAARRRMPRRIEPSDPSPTMARPPPDRLASPA
jgi:hypothetical protein